MPSATTASTTTHPPRHTVESQKTRTCSSSWLCCPASTAATQVCMMLLMAVGASWCGQCPAGASSRYVAAGSCRLSRWPQMGTTQGSSRPMCVCLFVGRSRDGKIAESVRGGAEGSKHKPNEKDVKQNSEECSSWETARSLLRQSVVTWCV